MRVCVASSVLVSLFALTGSALAQYTPGEAFASPALTGDTQYDGWIGLQSSNYPGYGGFPGNAAWPAPIGSNRTTANTFSLTAGGDAVLNKSSNGTGGGPYLAGSSIYFGGFSGDINNPGGTLTVTDSTPVAALKNVVFQVQIGEAWTYDFVSHQAPTLSYNGGNQQLVATGATIVERFFNGTVTMPTGEENVYINTHMLQWDLSAIAEPITSFSVSFAGVQHAQVYGLRLDQSNTFTPIPAPGAAALVGMGGLMALRRRRCR